jgi:NAD(P)-dependent dehydrogenase (short-subunit alcohol dehydrogenase family)
LALSAILIIEISSNIPYIDNINMSFPLFPTAHLETYPRLSPANLKGEYKNRNVVVTGGGYGIGSSIAESFAKAGVSSITLGGRTESKLQQTAVALQSKYPETEFKYHALDITSAESVKTFFDWLEPIPDILVNNAGFLASPENFVSADLKAWWEAFEVNILGSLRVTQAFLQVRSQPQTPGIVITVNTLASFSLQLPNLSSYAASKAGLARAIEMIAADVPPAVARFVSVHPGMVKTDMAVKSGLEGGFEFTDAGLSGDFIAWLASEEASFLSGRFVWANWDVDELIAAKSQIVERNLLLSSLQTT